LNSIKLATRNEVKIYNIIFERIIGASLSKLKIRAKLNQIEQI